MSRQSSFANHNRQWVQIWSVITLLRKCKAPFYFQTREMPHPADDSHHHPHLHHHPRHPHHHHPPPLHHHQHHRKTSYRMLDGVAVGAKESLKAEWMYRCRLITSDTQHVKLNIKLINTVLVRINNRHTAFLNESESIT